MILLDDLLVKKTSLGREINDIILITYCSLSNIFFKINRMKRNDLLKLKDLWIKFKNREITKNELLRNFLALQIRASRF